MIISKNKTRVIINWKLQRRITPKDKDHSEEKQAWIQRVPKFSPCVLPTKTKQIHQVFKPHADCVCLLWCHKTSQQTHPLETIACVLWWEWIPHNEGNFLSLWLLYNEIRWQISKYYAESLTVFGYGVVHVKREAWGKVGWLYFNEEYSWTPFAATLSINAHFTHMQQLLF